jgi:hypothetical protein
MKHNDGGFAASYNVQLCTDAANSIIVAVGVTQDRHDGDQLIPAMERVENNTGQLPEQIVADGAYINNMNIEATTKKGVELVGPAPTDERTKSCERRGISPEFYPDAFRYESTTDSYACPAGKTLKRKQRRYRNGRWEYNYRADKSECQACPLREQCCPKSEVRWVTRIEDSPAVRSFREKMRSEAAQNIYKQRKRVAEFPNAWIKEKLRLRKFRLRGLIKVGTEAIWACLTYNIQQWIRLRWKPKVVVACA